MPEVEYVTTLPLGREPVWEFVKDMNNWAPFLTGYQKHQIIDETDSIWTLKGDVGILSRVVEFRAHITEWSGPERVSFTLTGLNEAVEGGGTLRMDAIIAGETDPDRLLTLVHRGVRTPREISGRRYRGGSPPSIASCCVGL